MNGAEKMECLNLTSLSRSIKSSRAGGRAIADIVKMLVDNAKYNNTNTNIKDTHVSCLKNHHRLTFLPYPA